jgi:hypothetical protein
MRQAMAQDLRDAAGDKYSAAMEDLHKKLDLRDMVVDEVEKNPERYLQNIYRKGNTQKLKDLEIVDKELGLNLMDDIKLAQQAEEFGGRGYPSIFSQSTTGKSTMPMIGGGIGIGAVLSGNPLLAVIPTAYGAAHSPYVATRTIGASKGAGKNLSAMGEKISGLGKKLSKEDIEALGKINLKR